MKKLSKELAIKFFKEAMEHKGKGNYDAAKDSMSRAISYDPEMPGIHYENGKLNFIMGNFITSINSYLSFAHLELNKRVKQLNGEIDFPNREESENFYESLPEEAKKALPHKAASLILEDGDICNHIAHSFIGSQEVTDPEIINNIKVYYASIVGDLLLDMTVEQFDIDMNRYEEINHNLFIPQGRMILLDNIAWDDIDSTDVINLYFK